MSLVKWLSLLLAVSAATATESLTEKHSVLAAYCFMYEEGCTRVLDTCRIDCSIPKDFAQRYANGDGPLVIFLNNVSKEVDEKKLYALGTNLYSFHRSSQYPAYLEKIELDMMRSHMVIVAMMNKSSFDAELKNRIYGKKGLFIAEERRRIKSSEQDKTSGLVPERRNLPLSPPKIMARIRPHSPSDKSKTRYESFKIPHASESHSYNPKVGELFKIPNDENNFNLPKSEGRSSSHWTRAAPVEPDSVTIPRATETVTGRSRYYYGPPGGNRVSATYDGYSYNYKCIPSCKYQVTLPHAQDPTKFWHCGPKGSRVFQCPREMGFDLRRKGCDYRYSNWFSRKDLKCF